MASYVKVFRTVWQDTDFKALPAAAQRLYFVLISQPDLTSAGILGLTPGRWSSLAPDTTPADMRAALQHLTTGRFVLVDDRTEEVWIRSYIVHDEAWRIPNSRKALIAAAERVLSEPLRHAITATLSTLGLTLGPTEAASVAVAPRLPQQPAASIQEPAASSQQPPTDPVDNLGPPAATELAAAAIELLIEHRCHTERPRSRGAYAKALRKHLPAEYGPALAAYTTTNPDATAHDLAHHVLGVPGPPPPPPDMAPAARNLGIAIAQAQIAAGAIDGPSARAEITATLDPAVHATAWEAYDNLVLPPATVTPIQRRA